MAEHFRVEINLKVLSRRRTRDWIKLKFMSVEVVAVNSTLERQKIANLSLIKPCQGVARYFRLSQFSKPNIDTNRVEVYRLLLSWNYGSKNRFIHSLITRAIFVKRKRESRWLSTASASTHKAASSANKSSNYVHNFDLSEEETTRRRSRRASFRRHSVRLLSLNLAHRS